MTEETHKIEDDDIRNLTLDMEGAKHQGQRALALQLSSARDRIV